MSFPNRLFTRGEARWRFSSQTIQGISQGQLNILKTRMEATKATIERAQSAPPSQQQALLSTLSGDQISGDLLTATIWSYFATLQSHGVIAGSQAQIFDAPALSYGLFHAQVRPNKLYGIVTTGITMQGLNLDVGHLRSVRWVEDDNPDSTVNQGLASNNRSAAQNRWIAYNKMRGQFSSAMEHAVPEQFWVDRKTCRYVENNRTINPALAPCREAVSAVKAIALATQEGQKLYTINRQNSATALPKLPIGGSVASEIRNAVASGKEVMVHERVIESNGWKGFGYVITDEETGGSGYIIEGVGNGGWLTLDDVRNIIYTMLGVLADAIAIAVAIKDYLINFIGMLLDGCPAAIIIPALVSMALVTSAFLFLGATIYSVVIIGFWAAFAVGLLLGYMINAMWGAWRSVCKA